VKDTDRAAFHSPMPPASTTPGLGSTLCNYLWLTKPLVIILLLSTTLGAMLVAQRGAPAWSLIFFALLGGALTAGGASAINSYADRDIDPLMGRTARRPIPSGAIAPHHALAFGLGLSFAGVLVFGVFVNWLSAALSSIGLFYYVVIYTLWLKRTTPQNIVIGGAAGAIPPLVGWAAVTNEISLLAVFLFLIVFHWTPPHTWALMLMVTKDYQRAGVPMMPVAQGEDATRLQIVLYTLSLIVVTGLPYAFQLLGLGYLLAALALGAWLLYLAVQLWRDRSKATARRLYRHSNYYLALIFLAAVLASIFGW